MAPIRDGAIPFSSEEEWEVDQFINKAKALLIEHDVDYPEVGTTPLTTKDIYVVWFSKTLQNWKTLLSTSRANGLYYEITYNGDQQEAYLDVYMKISNTVYPDNE